MKLWILGITMLLGTTAWAEDFAVVVGDQSPLAKKVAGGALSAGELKDIFLGQTKMVGGVRLKPLNAKDANDASAFLQEVCQMSVSAYSAAWMKKVFSEGGTPPQVMDSSSDVVKMVKQEAGAVGYVPVSVAEGAGLKIVGRVTRK